MESHRILFLFALISVVSLAQACSSNLTVSRLSVGNSSEGIIYFLPRSQFDITLTRELTKCDPVKRTVIISETIGQPERNARVNGLKYGAVNVLVSTTVAVTQRYIADPEHSYVIKYQTLNSPLKTTDIQVDLYENGTLKTVNATIEDRSKEVITQSVKGIASIAMVAVPSARLVFLKSAREITVGVDVPPLSLCTERISTTLQTVERLRQEIRKVEAMIAETKDATVRKEREDELQRLQQQMSDARKPLTHVQHYTLTPAISYERPTFTVDRLELEQGVALLWFEQNAVKELSGNLTQGRLVEIIKDEEPFKHWKSEQGKLKILDPGSDDFHAEFPLKGKIDPSERYPVALDVFSNALVLGYGPSHQTTTGEREEGGRRETRSPQGIVYRQPVEGDLMMCHELSCLSQTGVPQVAREERLFSKSFLIPQAGILGNLPLHNGMFDRNTIIATFSEVGTLISFRYTTEAEAEKASASFAETAEALTKTRLETIKAKTELLDAETKRLEALKKKEEAEKALEKTSD